jgi:hypothetical protein
MSDQQYLVEALTAMGYKPEVQHEGTALRGYGGVAWNRPVQVIIPRHQLNGALAPIGFGRDASGVFQAVIDDLDRQYLGLDQFGSGASRRRIRKRRPWPLRGPKAMCFGAAKSFRRRKDPRFNFVSRSDRKDVMQAKLILIEIDETGNSTIDLAGFQGQGCGDVAKRLSWR